MLFQSLWTYGREKCEKWAELCAWGKRKADLHSQAVHLYTSAGWCVNTLVCFLHPIGEIGSSHLEKPHFTTVERNKMCLKLRRLILQSENTKPSLIFLSKLRQVLLFKVIVSCPHPSAAWQLDVIVCGHFWYSFQVIMCIWEWNPKILCAMQDFMEVFISPAAAISQTDLKSCQIHKHA